MAKKNVGEEAKKSAYQTVEQLCQELETTPNGLKESQIETMRQGYGTNVFYQKKRMRVANALAKAFITPFHGILFLLAVISVTTDVFVGQNFARNTSTAFIIFAMIIISGTIRLVQELRAKYAADQLDKLLHGNVLVKRDNIWKEIPAEKLVVGDLVSFAAGDRIPADIRLTQTTDLFISQAAITGESAILEKNSDVVPPLDKGALTEKSNLAFTATVVISGKGQGIVVAVGENTLYGSAAKTQGARKNSFQKGANSIAWVMLRFMAVLIPIVFVVIGITGGKWAESLAFALSVSVGLIPEMLPMVITACLAKGSLSMSKKQTIVKNINAMQSFGSMDVLCMDKTGTLTNESILLEYYMDVLGNEKPKVLDFAYLNSSYHSGVRNPIDNAILACHTMPNKQQHFCNLTKQYHKMDEIPFDYTRKIASVLVQDNTGSCEMIVKGDIEEVVRRCTSIEYQGQVLPMENQSMENVWSVVEEMLQDGMKVIAVASKPICTRTICQKDEQELTLMGYIAFFDAPKATAKESIKALQKLQVAPKILTGDKAQVAMSICRRVGISPQGLLTGAQLEKLTEQQLIEAVQKVNVFAELTPSQKVSLVAALQKNKHTVGFLGDGINDIPAMNQADVGISVDTAVDAAKEAADVVLLQKDLNVLEQGILEGRRIFTNMLKYIKITASSNFGNILSIVCASAFLPFLPMTSIQILLLNLLYDTLCIVLPWDAVDDEAIACPKEWNGKTLGRFMRWFGPISSLFDIGTFVFLYYIICPMLCGGQLYHTISDRALQMQYIAVFQTGWFLESIWTQVLILHFLRTPKIPFIQSRPSIPVVCITFVGLLVLTALPFVATGPLFGFTKLPFWYFGFLAVTALCYMILSTLCKSRYQKKYQELI